MSRVIRCSVCGGLCNPDKICCTCKRMPHERDQHVEARRVAAADAEVARRRFYREPTEQLPHNDQFDREGHLIWSETDGR